MAHLFPRSLGVQTPRLHLRFISPTAIVGEPWILPRFPQEDEIAGDFHGFSSLAALSKEIG